MRRGIAVGILACISLSVTGCGGCGGGMSAAYMRAHAIRRPKDDEKPGLPNPNANKPYAQSKPKADTARPSAAPATPVQPNTAGANPAVQNSGAPNRPGGAPPAVGAAQTPAVVAPAVVSPTTALPKTVAERRARTIQNMTALGVAIERYAQAKGVYFTPSINAAGTKAPLLSWRVELLPYLGLVDLYQKFHLNEPWDSPHNKQLLAQIPGVYQSPERFDEKTNYLLAVGGSAAFRPRQMRGFSPREFDDGVENTILLVEASDEFAVPWTRPDDFDATRNKIGDMRGKLRSDGLFVLWGGGRVGLLGNDINDKLLSTFLTIDGGDNTVAAATISFAPSAEPQAAAVATGGMPSGVGTTVDAGHPTGSSGASPPAATVVDPRAAPAAGAAGASIAAGGSSPASSKPAKPLSPVPTAEQLKAAKKLLDDVYGKEVRDARTAEEKQKLAEKLMGELTKLEDDRPGQYALLGEVFRLSVEVGDAVTALKAIEALCSRFEVNGTALRVGAIEKFSSGTSVPSEEANRLILKYAYELTSQALDEDDFEAAEKMYSIAVAAARRTRRQDVLRALQKKRREIEIAQLAFREVERVIDELEKHPNAPEANLAVGKYYCFVKGNWSKGLPMLARSSDEGLRSMAEDELDMPVVASQQVELGDGWWTLATDELIPLKRHMQLRAVYWYQKALPQLSEGLQKVKVELRLKDVEREYGKTDSPSLSETTFVRP